MRRAILVVLALGLAGCSKPQTPLSHAIDALRAGDQGALTAAHQEADEALKTAVQPDTDMCMLGGEDIRKYSEAARVAKLDDSQLLKLPEEDRLLYALKIAGPSPKITDDPRLMASPLYRAMSDWNAMQDCKQVPDARVKLDAASIAAAQASEDTEVARSDALKGWMEDLRQHHGTDFDTKMRSAASHLGDAGYSAPWPAETQFLGEDRPGTFREVQDRLRARNDEDSQRDVEESAERETARTRREKSLTTFELMQARMRERGR